MSEQKPRRPARVALGRGTEPPGELPTWLVEPDLHLYAIASPFAGSTLAAHVALEATAASLAASPPVTSTLERRECAQLRTAIVSAEARWFERVAADPSLHGQGATFAAVFLAGGHASVAHLGDCRVHQIRDSQILRKTADHTAQTSSGRRALLRAIGLDSNPHVVSWDAKDEDTFLLTAGVHDLMSEHELLEVVQTSPDPAHATARLLEVASLRGARDYLTALIVRPFASEVA